MIGVILTTNESDVWPGMYSLFEINPPEYATDVSDYDNDVSDSDRVLPVVDNIIGFVLAPGEDDDAGNGFTDSDGGSISGTFKEDKGRPLAGVVLAIATSTGTVVATRMATDSIGAYIFKNVKPGANFVTAEALNHLEYPSYAKDQDSTENGDSGNKDASTVDNSISVTLQKRENHTGR